jgi:nucleotide-binding universal stress UspA family protein
LGTARLKDAQERLAHRAAPIDRAQIRTTTDVVFGSSARTIVEYAADHDYDLIVMGTHGRKGMAHLLIGSVAEHVVRTATCPVLATHELREKEWAAMTEETEESAVPAEGLS